MVIPLRSGENPRVSVVIPSYRRHEEVVRAVRSALHQTHPPFEVIVANDGPDPDKAQLLADLGNEHIRFFEAPRRGNASATRNFGIKQAQGDWIALLDDDDIWVHRKLELQFLALKRSSVSTAILAGMERVHLGHEKSLCRPSRTLRAAVSVHEVLFSKAGGVHTSTIMAPTPVFRAHPFNEEAERHEDWEWLLGAGRELPLVVAPEVVCERRLRLGEGLSRSGGYAYTREWYARNRALMPETVRGRFISTILSRKAAHDRALSAVPWMLRELNSNAALGPSNLGRLFLPWFLSGRMRHWLRDLLTR